MQMNTGLMGSPALPQSLNWAVIAGAYALHFATGCGSNPAWYWTPREPHDFSEELCALSMAQDTIHCLYLQYKFLACWLHGIFPLLFNILLLFAKWNPMLACAFQKSGWSCLLWKDGGMGSLLKERWMYLSSTDDETSYLRKSTSRTVMCYTVFLMVTLINILTPTCRQKNVVP